MGFSYKQEVTKDKIQVWLSESVTFTITREEVLDYYRSQTGNAAEKKAKTLEWLKEQLVASYPEGDLTSDRINVDVDTSNPDEPIFYETHQ